ncbi:MAG: lytic transglycosylase domain-containing protein [Alphaproteobacteria bacterium]|nr:lytic transglycosylase domain-containing protein [Alphaproteobacteria bacterium]
MSSLSRILLIFLCLLAQGIPLAAKAAGNTALDSAFLFANRRDWDNALAHATRSGDGALIRLITWESLLDPDTHASFQEIAAFMREHPQWPQQSQLKLRAEQALRSSQVDDATLLNWFAASPPISGTGKMHFAEALMRGGQPRDSEHVVFLLREAWRNGDFDENEEQRILAAYADLLREQDHIEREDRLLWEEKIKPALRMLDILSGSYRTLSRARIALLTDARDAPFLNSQVPAALQAYPGLLYARMGWHARRGDEAGVRAILLNTPAYVPYPEKWWRMREPQVRKAIAERDYVLARRLLEHHEHHENGDLADARWLSGWLFMAFGHDAQNAYLQFYHLAEEVKSPGSKARAEYWAARAAEKLGDQEAARDWYGTAAEYPTTFYGQLGAVKLRGNASLRFPAEPAVSAAARRNAERSDLVRAMRLAAAAKQPDMATTLLNAAIDAADGPESIAAIAGIAAAGDTMLGVRAARRALQRGIILPHAGYPRLKLSPDAPEPAFVHAVIRQESDFDLTARSRAGAIGLMQLLPATARETARKTGYGFKPIRLYEARYNVQMGSAYLGRLLRAYHGSYVLAAAAYNAGPGRVREWIGMFGMPGGGVDGTAEWVEKIPYAETRNYVMHVVENLEVYRQLLGGGPLRMASDGAASGQ